MGESYFIKRGEAVDGPFSLKKLQKALVAKKLKSNDLIALGQNGPWRRMASVYKSIGAGVAPQLPDPTIPEPPEASQTIEEESPPPLRRFRKQRETHSPGISVTVLLSIIGGVVAICMIVACVIYNAINVSPKQVLTSESLTENVTRQPIAEIDFANKSGANKNAQPAVTVPVGHDKGAITKVLNGFRGATDMPARMTFVYDKETVRGYMIKYYRDYFLKLAKGVAEPLPVVESVTIEKETDVAVEVIAHFKGDAKDFRYRLVKTENGYLIDWIFGRRNQLLSMNIMPSEVKARAWELILPEHIVGYSLRESKKIDFLEGTTFTLGSTLAAGFKDSQVNNEYATVASRNGAGISEAENVTEIEVIVFKDDEFAKQEFGIIRESAFGDPSSSFYCKQIDIPSIGDQSLCKQWERFAPEVVAIKGNVIVKVSCRIVYPLRNLTENNALTLQVSFESARLQVSAIK